MVAKVDTWKKGSFIEVVSALLKVSSAMLKKRIWEALLSDHVKEIKQDGFEYICYKHRANYYSHF